MKINETELEGVFIIENFQVSDNRSFRKTYHKEFSKKIDFVQILKRVITQYQKNVIRGMHFQLPPNDHEKLVYVVKVKL